MLKHIEFIQTCIDNVVMIFSLHLVKQCVIAFVLTGLQILKHECSGMIWSALTQSVRVLIDNQYIIKLKVYFLVHNQYSDKWYLKFF